MFKEIIKKFFIKKREFKKDNGYQKEIERSPMILSNIIKMSAVSDGGIIRII